MERPIELAIIIGITFVWLAVVVAAYPTTGFAKWGIKKFGSYNVFMSNISAYMATPCLFFAVLWGWRELATWLFHSCK